MKLVWKKRIDPRIWKLPHLLGDRKMGNENDDESLILVKGFFYVDYT